MPLNCMGRNFNHGGYKPCEEQSAIIITQNGWQSRWDPI